MVLSGCGNNNSNNAENPTPTPEITADNGAGNDNGQANESDTDTEQPETDASTEGQSDVTITQSIIDQIQKDIEFPVMGPVPNDLISEMYYINPGTDIANGSFQSALMNVKATDLVVIELKDEADFDTIKEALTKRAEDVIQSFSSYLPDQYEDAKNYQIVQKGKYVLYSISHDQQKVLESFENQVK